MKLRITALLGWLICSPMQASAEEKSILDCQGTIVETDTTASLSLYRDPKLHYIVVIKSGSMTGKAPADGYVTSDEGLVLFDADGDQPAGQFAYVTKSSGSLEGTLHYFKNPVDIVCRFNEK
jgi:hypothetical protein